MIAGVCQWIITARCCIVLANVILFGRRHCRRLCRNGWILLSNCYNHNSISVDRISGSRRQGRNHVFNVGVWFLGLGITTLLQKKIDRSTHWCSRLHNHTLLIKSCVKVGGPSNFFCWGVRTPDPQWLRPCSLYLYTAVLNHIGFHSSATFLRHWLWYSTRWATKSATLFSTITLVFLDRFSK